MSQIDEFLGNVIVDNITPDNVGSYIRKDADDYANLLDAMLLITRRDIDICENAISHLSTQSGILPVSRMFHGDDYPALKCKELILFLNEIPGRDALYRLYRYSESIIIYLNGEIVDAQPVNLKRENNERDIISLTNPRKRRHTDIFASKIRSLDKMIDKYEIVHDRMDKFYSISDANNSFTDHFYAKCFDILETTETSSESSDSEYVNVERRRAVNEAIIKTESNRCHGTNELTWTRVVEELGYEKFTWRQMMDCGRMGADMKRANGESKSSKYKGKREQFVYYESDREGMTEIIKQVELAGTV